MSAREAVRAREAHRRATFYPEKPARRSKAEKQPEKAAE